LTNELGHLAGSAGLADTKHGYGDLAKPISAGKHCSAQRTEWTDGAVFEDRYKLAPCG